MSSESTPILSRAIAYFEMFMTEWEKLGERHPILKPWTQIGLRWATKYYIRMDETSAYVVTMCKFNSQVTTLLLTFHLVLNPAMRVSWIEEQWDTKYIQSAKAIVLELVSAN